MFCASLRAQSELSRSSQDVMTSHNTGFKQSFAAVHQFIHCRIKLFRFVLLTFAFLLVLIVLRRHSTTLARQPAAVLPCDASTTDDWQQQTTSDRKYLSFCKGNFYGNHRTGNHLFMLSSLVYASDRINRTLVVPDASWILDETFDLRRGCDDVEIRRLDPELIYSDVYSLIPANKYNPDDRLHSPKGQASLRRISRRTIGLCGLYQTFIYADAVAPTLRRLLTFRPEIQQSVRRFFDVHRPVEWAEGTFVRVGVHVRRGDFLTPSEWAWGLTVVDDAYLNASFRYFMRRHDSRVQFVVTSDDLEWTKNALVRLFWNGTDSPSPADTDTLESFRLLPLLGGSFASLSVGRTAGEDMALLASCDALILSTGSFGWWAAWLANKTTIYYANWPRVGSQFEKSLRRDAYFPPHWMPMM